MHLRKETEHIMSPRVLPYCGPNNHEHICSFLFLSSSLVVLRLNLLSGLIRTCSEAPLKSDQIIVSGVSELLFGQVLDSNYLLRMLLIAMLVLLVKVLLLVLLLLLLLLPFLLLPLLRLVLVLRLVLRLASVAFLLCCFCFRCSHRC